MRKRENRSRGVATWTSVVALGLTSLGCGPPAEVPARELSDEERRLELRERLQEALGDDYGEPLPAATETELAQGAELWEALCASCHGSGGGGTRQLSRMLPIPPGSLKDPERAAFLSERAKLRIIRDGSEGTPMTGWKDVLTESEMRAVLAHVQTLVIADE
jgi:mono/diheme cytochrome c family protein